MADRAYGQGLRPMLICAVLPLLEASPARAWLHNTPDCCSSHQTPCPTWCEVRLFQHKLSKLDPGPGPSIRACPADHADLKSAAGDSLSLCKSGGAWSLRDVCQA